MSQPGNLRGALAALLAMALYSGHDAIIKHLSAAYPPLQILFFSSLLGFPLIAAVLLHDPRPATLRPNRPFWVALRSACIVGSGIAGYYAFSVLPMAQVYALLFSAPLMITVLSVPFLGERVGRPRGLAVIVGLAGVLVVLRPGATTPGFGHLAALTGAACSAMAAIAVRKMGRSERMMTLLIWPILGNFVASGATLGLAYRPMELGDLALSGAIAGLSVTAAYMLILAYQAGEAAVIAPMQYSQMVWAAIYGWLVFDEPLGLATFIGAGLIISSGIYILLRETRAHQPPGAGLVAPGGVVPRPNLLVRLRRPGR